MSNYLQSIALQENSSCVELYAYFGLAGNLENPNEITSLLKIQPTWAFAKGQIIYSRGKPKGKRREGTWGFSSKNKLETTSMEKHLIFLLDKIEPFNSELICLVNQLSLTVIFNCTWTFNDTIGGPIITPETLKKIANLGGYLSMATKSFRAFDDDDDDNEDDDNER